MSGFVPNRRASSLHDNRETSLIRFQALPEVLREDVDSPSVGHAFGGGSVQRTSSDTHIETFDDQDLSVLAQEVLPGNRKGESQMGGRTQVSCSRETRVPGQVSAPA